MTPDINNLLAIFHNGTVIWILCLGALACLLIDSIWPKKMASLVYSVGISTLVAALVAAARQWINPEAFIKQDLLVFDMLTLFVLMLILVIGILTLFNALCYMRVNQVLTSEFCSLVLFTIIGMIFLFASDHLLVNFIGLETMSLSIYVLVGSHKKNLKSNEAAIKYFIMGGIASAILLFGIALFYGGFQTMQLSTLALLETSPSLDYLRQLAIALILVGIFFKMAVVPFHFWAPDVYEGAPAPVTGFMATAVKVAVLGFALRLFMALDIFAEPQVKMVLTVIVIATLIVGNVVAVLQEDVKRMLAYSSISHAGFLLFGLLVSFEGDKFVAANASSVLFYLLGYLFMTLGAFAILSLLTREKSEASNYADLVGLGQKHPILAGLFTLFMLSMVGMPGTVGFAAKYGVISLAVQNGHIPLAILAVIASVISAFYYLRPSVIMFFKTDNRPSVVNEIPFTATISITLCAFVVLYLGLCPDVFLKLAQIAASPLTSM